jgi:hypothetical protein
VLVLVLVLLALAFVEEDFVEAGLEPRQALLKEVHGACTVDVDGLQSVSEGARCEVG